MRCPTPGGCLQVRVATDFWMRARGLLFGSPLAQDEALLIAPCSSIHTFAMRYPIDVMFLDRRARIVRVCPHVPAGRIRFEFGAAAVLELRAGQASHHGLVPGVRLESLAAIGMSSERIATPGPSRTGDDGQWLETVGWFGKIPALGDFVGRRLPPQFIEAWDNWLSAEIVAAQQALGPDWPQSYLQAPTWRFALTPGVLGVNCWYGILTPSVDRVGRQFPLTIAATSKAPIGEPSNWWVAVVAVALQARAAHCDSEALDAALLGTLEPRSAQLIEPPCDGGAGDTAVSVANSGSHWSPWRPESSEFGPVLTFKALPTGPDFLRLIRPD